MAEFTGIALQTVAQGEDVLRYAQQNALFIDREAALLN